MMFWIIGGLMFAGIMMWAVVENRNEMQYIRQQEQERIQNLDAVFDIRDLLKEKPAQASRLPVPKSLYHTH